MRTAFAALLLTGWSSLAAAQPRDRLAVGKLEVFGEPGVPAERLTRLRANLLGGFAASGLAVVADDEVKQKIGDNPTLLQCQSDLCFKALGDAVGAKWVLAGSLSVGSATSYSADLRLVDVGSGRPVAQYSNTCGVCTTAEANDWVGLVAADLKRQLDATRPKPAAAIAAGVVEPPPPPTVPARRVWAFRGAALGAFALGAAGFILGGVEKARDGRACTVVAPATDCAQRRDTTAGQTFGFVAGGVFLVGAAILTYYGWWRWRGHTLALIPSASPSSARAELAVSF